MKISPELDIFFRKVSADYDKDFWSIEANFPEPSSVVEQSDPEPEAIDVLDEIMDMQADSSLEKEEYIATAYMHLTNLVKKATADKNQKAAYLIELALSEIDDLRRE